jgi:hypothetical protein
MKTLIKAILPEPIWNILRKKRSEMRSFITNEVTVRLKKYITYTLNSCGLNVIAISDFYSPLPVVSKLRDNTDRWVRPSDLIGIHYDIEYMKRFLQHLVHNYYNEYSKLPSYKENSAKGYGPGFTIIDAMIEYFMIRDIKPKRYVEIGSGLSTYYSYLAAEENARNERPLKITCIDPYPFENIYDIPGIEIVKKEVQDIELSVFEQLDEGDVLFIDSTHIIKIDGDVPYLYLEVIPRLKKGVKIHIHDVHFPYNIPYPPQFYIFGRKEWLPVFFNEAMLLQAFLSYNDAYKIMLSVPLLRFYSEDYLWNTFPEYVPLEQDNTDTHFGSIWIEKVK